MKRLGMTEKWVRGELSNFDYVMMVNQVSGRSLHDITQYPVFPWIFNNYAKMNADVL